MNRPQKSPKLKPVYHFGHVAPGEKVGQKKQSFLWIDNYCIKTLARVKNKIIGRKEKKGPQAKNMPFGTE